MLKPNLLIILACLSLTPACTEQSSPSTPASPGQAAAVDDFPMENILRIDGLDPQGGDSPFSYRYRVRYQGSKGVFHPFVQARESGQFVVRDTKGEKIYLKSPDRTNIDSGALNLYVDGFYKDKERMDTLVRVEILTPKTKTEPWSWTLSSGGVKNTKVSTKGTFALDNPDLAALKGKAEWLDYCAISGDDASNVILGAILFGADPKLRDKDFFDRINGAKKAYLFGVRLADED